MVYREDFATDVGDIPEITNYPKTSKRPPPGKMKDGYTIVVEHKDYDEIITVKKQRVAKGDGEKLSAPKEG